MNGIHSDIPDSAAATDVPGYRPVSVVAVAALALGVLSAVSLVSPLFLVVPLVAVAVAVAALADVGREGAAKAGRLAAVAGLALAIGFGAQAVVSGVVKRSILSARAVAAAEILLEAVRDGRQGDVDAMCGMEARDAVGKLAACGARGVCRAAGAGEEPGTWAVHVAASGPDDCTARLVLAPSVAVHRRGSIERWFVTACEVEGPTVRPSGN